jgi:glycosyltransferase involved in cell wall biosynthesis
MPPERIHVLPYIAPKYMLSAQASPDFDARYRLPEKFIFYPARFWAHKNHKNLISAMAKLKNEIPDLKLVLSGTQSHKYDSYESVMKQAADLGLADAVFPLGYVPDEDMPELYRRARALVMPTYYGPTNIPPLEAFASGCPVAVSGIYGMPEQVGDAALLFNPDSVAEIADCIRKLWADDRLCAELAEKGKRRAASWGWQQFNGRLMEIIVKITGEENGLT